MRYNKSFDRSEHTRIHTNNNSNHSENVAFSSCCIFLYILLGAFEDAKGEEVRKEVSQLALCRTHREHNTYTHTSNIFVSESFTHFCLFVFFFEEKRGKKADSPASRIKEIEGEHAREEREKSSQERILI